MLVFTQREAIMINISTDFVLQGARILGVLLLLAAVLYFGSRGRLGWRVIALLVVFVVAFWYAFNPGATHHVLVAIGDKLVEATKSFVRLLAEAAQS